MTNKITCDDQEIDPINGSDDGYENYLREKEEEQEDVRHGFEDWEIDPEMGAHG